MTLARPSSARLASKLEYVTTPTKDWRGESMLCCLPRNSMNSRRKTLPLIALSTCSTRTNEISALPHNALPSAAQETKVREPLSALDFKPRSRHQRPVESHLFQQHKSASNCAKLEGGGEGREGRGEEEQEGRRSFNDMFIVSLTRVTGTMCGFWKVFREISTVCEVSAQLLSFVILESLHGSNCINLEY